ncbi:hypothetical protein M0Q97_10640 [Candidatus Dojkabacteria bacterium]|jgi:hypothetical protein|nr:hypothetical protein [Candidatus Dojkabacteria bacterium]
MTGAFLILMIVVAIIGLLFVKYSYDLEGLGYILLVFSVMTAIVLLISIPISRIDSKAEVESIKQFQIVLTESRNLENYSEFERIKIIETIDEYNRKIAQWKTKGQHWYNNKWYYSSECQNVDYLK